MQEAEIKIRIGEIVKRIRKEKKLTLVQLSELSGVQLATISRIENNKITGTLESHAQLCIALGIELSELYKDIKLLPETRITQIPGGLG